MQLRQYHFLIESVRTHGDSDECLIWPYAKKKTGYGTVWIDKRNIRAHRAAYQLIHGPIPGGLYLLHSCDTPSCYNPNHVAPGTQLQNIREASARGRLKRNPENSHTAIINFAKAREIRHLRKTQKIKIKHLAEMFGISIESVSNVLYNRTWIETQPIKDLEAPSVLENLGR